MRNTATRWTLIGAARGGDAEAQRQFADKYRGPVVAYLRRRGLDADAEDVTQEIFLRLFRGGVLDRATESSGRFRDLLLAVTKHALADHWRAAGAVKRGGRADVRPLGDVDPASPTSEDVTFQQEWLLNLIEHCLERLRTDHPNYHRALRLTLFEGKARADAAAELGHSEASVRNWVHRGRRKLISYVREEAWSYSGTQEAYRDELSYLARLLGEQAS